MRSKKSLMLIVAVLMLVVAIGCSKRIAAPEKQAPAAPMPSLEKMLKIVTPYSAGRVHDGSYLYINWPEGTNQLYHKTAGGVQRLTNFEDGMGYYALNPQRTKALVLAAPGGNEQWDIYLLDLADRSLKPLLQNPEIRYEDPYWNPDGSGFIYTANTPSPKDFFIYYYDMKTGESRLEVDAPGANFPSTFSPDGKRFGYVRYHSVNNAEAWVKELGAKGQGTRVVVTETPTYSAPRGFLADGRVVLTTNKGSDFKYPALFNMQDKSLTAIEQRSWPLEQLGVSRTGNTIAYVFNVDAVGTLVIRKADGTEMPVPDLPPGLINITDLEDDQVVFDHNAGSTPTTLYSWNFNTSRLETIAAADLNGVDTRAFRGPKVARVKSFDGLEIPVLMYEPAGEGPHPYVVYCHGGPEGQSRPWFSRLFQYLLMNGFGIAAPNVRGSTGYGSAFADADNYKKRMDSVKDLKAVTDWLIASGKADAKRVAVMGGSYGGFMVMAGITEYPDLYAASVNSVGIVDFENFLKNTKPYRRKLREVEYGPLSDVEFLRSVSPIRKLDRVKTPLFIVHGRNDPRVPVSEAESIGAKLKELNRPVELMIFEDEGHGIRKLENRMIYYPTMVKFLKKHLGVK